MDHPRIQSDPKVMMGKPVIRGTRITVEHILRCPGGRRQRRAAAGRLSALDRGGHTRGPGLCRRPSGPRVRIPCGMTVRLFADECVAGTIIERLREVGFDIVRAADVCPTTDDEEVLAAGPSDQRVLVTADKDFGELVVRLGAPLARGREHRPWRPPSGNTSDHCCRGAGRPRRSDCREHRDDRTGPCADPSPFHRRVLQPRPSPISSMLRRTQSPG